MSASEQYHTAFNPKYTTAFLRAEAKDIDRFVTMAPVKRWVISGSNWSVRQADVTEARKVAKDLNDFDKG